MPIDARKTKADANFQPTPKARMRCEVCAHFIPTDACNALRGTISRSGWCDLYKGRNQSKEPALAG